MLGNRYSQHSFARAPQANIQRSKFDRSFGMKDTYDFDYLVPIFVDEILPGDDINLNVNTFQRLATQQVPIMDNMKVDFFFFFVPNRLVWDHWEEFNGAQKNPGDSTDFLVPQVTGTWAVGSLGDKFGIPTGIASSVNALPFRAHNLIFNEWFRDQNLQNSLNVPTTDGPDTAGTYTLYKRAKKHDYFTSALPWPQKGPSVSIPLGVAAPVWAQTDMALTGTSAPSLKNSAGGAFASTFAANYTVPNPQWSGTPGPTVAGGNMLWNDVGAKLTQATVNSGFSGTGVLYADLSDASAATINSLRQAFLVQSLYEKDARGGTRYVEILRMHFGVVSPDFRLQRPEYVGGGSIDINTHPVAQTAPGDSPQASLASYATASAGGSRVGFTKSFVEHGYVIGYACARADITYQQGLNRLWSRQTRFDFFWPGLQQLGEQAITKGEIYYTGNPTNDNVAFGYQERNAEYRYKPSEVHGKFRSSDPQSLDFWHLAEEFGSAPVLGSTFIQQNTPIQRALAVTDEPHLIADYFFSYRHARPMTAYAVPATLGRF